ncbi:MAG TPA: DinB family protein [Pyrinomonadaceae bacterium]|jgi:uncharacterized damage-inducible protein DinB|nr:DinB family protein [Pyrinomonadaceae bacterium]
MKQYLIDTLRFNDWANKKMLAAAEPAADKKDVAAIFSHLVYAQDRWLKRVKNDSTESQIEWWGTPYAFEELGERWEASLNSWLDHLAIISDEDLAKQIKYTAASFDNGDSQSLRDIVLQLNYHSILHREGVALRLRDQGLEPPFVDYLYYLPPQNSEFVKAAV